MLSLNQTLMLAGAAALVALTAASIPALAPIKPYQHILMEDRQTGECQQLRRAMSRRACVARLGQEVSIDRREISDAQPSRGGTGHGSLSL